MEKFFIQFFPKYKLSLFSILPNAHIVDIEYPQGICSPIFVVQVFAGLFLQLSIFLIKDSISAWIRVLSARSHVNYWNQVISWRDLWKFWNVSICRNKSGPFPLLSVAGYWQSSNTEACAKKLFQILANNIDNGWRGIGLRISVTYYLKNGNPQKNELWKLWEDIINFYH